MSTLTPNYVDIDYNTIISRMKALLSQSDTFKDYDFEGANFTVLMELMAYLGELNTYYSNMLAKNIHNETADVYEVVHSLVRRQGYEPQGYMSGSVSASVNISTTSNITGVSPLITGTTFSVPQWSSFRTSSGIKYTSTSSLNHIISDISLVGYDGVKYTYSFPITLVQGEPVGILKFNHNDITDGIVYLSNDTWDFNIDNNSIEVVVDTITSGTVVYKRVTDLYSYLNPSPYTYVLRYDKYKRYLIQFTSTLDIKQDDNIISITCLRSKGSAGSIGGSTTWSRIDYPMYVPSYVNDGMIGSYITMDGDSLTADKITITNTNPSINNNDPDSVPDMKLGGNSNIYTQLRNVTSEDYKSNLIGYNNIANALAWGEKEETMGISQNYVDVRNYNKVYISVVPDSWVTNTSSGIIIGRLGWLPSTTYYTGNIVYNNNNYYICTNISSGISDVSTGPISTTTDISDGTCTWNYICTNQYLYSDEFTQGSLYNLDSITTLKLYSDIFKHNLLNYLKPRKIIGVYEIPIVPQLVYFKYIIGFRVKTPYIWTAVKSDIHTKLSYYFSNSFRNFGDTIDSGDIINFIMDTSIVSTTYSFPNIKGIQNLNIRNVVTFTPDNLTNTKVMSVGATGTSFENPFYVFNQNNPDNPEFQPVNEYPFYLRTGSDPNNNIPLNYDNMMKPIKLGFKQYPMLASELCVYINEER